MDTTAPKLTVGQATVLKVLADGPARISNKTVAEPPEARRVGQAVWTFAYGNLRPLGAVTTWGEGEEWWADITDTGRKLMVDRQIRRQA